MLFSQLKNYPNLPCIDCPFISQTKEEKAFCNIYSNNSVGLEACKELSEYVAKYGNKPFCEKDGIITF